MTGGAWLGIAAVATVPRDPVSLRPRTASVAPTKAPMVRMQAAASVSFPLPRFARPGEFRRGWRDCGGGGGDPGGLPGSPATPGSAMRSSSSSAARSCRSAPDDRRTACSLCAAAATSPALSLPRSRISLARRARVSLVSFNRVQPALANRIGADKRRSTESAWAPTRKNDCAKHNPNRPWGASDHSCNESLCHALRRGTSPGACKPKRMV